MAAAWSPAVRGGRLVVDVAQVLEDSKSALQHVLGTTPGWSEEAAAAASVEQVSGALTNLVYRCRSPAATANSTVIVRVFGSGGKLFSQKDERNIFKLASDLGLGPKCLVEYENGRVEEFLPGESLSSGSMRDPAVSAAIATALAAFHVRMLARLPGGHAAGGAAEAAAPGAAGAAAEPGGGMDGASPAGASAAVLQGGKQRDSVPELQPAIFGRIRKWYAAAQQVCQDRLQELGLGSLLEEVDAMQAQLAAQFPAWVGFCHNDLQYGNMLLARSSTGEPSAGAGAAAAEAGAGVHAGAPETAAAAAQQMEDPPAAASGPSPSASEAADRLSIAIIDYEYSTLNDVAFDAANFFCEWAYNYHSDEAHVFHDSWQPTREQQLHFCRAYIAAMQQSGNQGQQAGRPQQGEQQAGLLGGGEDTPPAKRRAVLLAPLPEAGARLQQRILSSTVASADSAAINASSNDATADSTLEAAAAMLARKAACYVPLSHLKWGLWGLIQDRTSDVDFNYLSYGRQRIERYHTTKHALLGGQGR